MTAKPSHKATIPASPSPAMALSFAAQTSHLTSPAFSAPPNDNRHQACGGRDCHCAGGHCTRGNK